MSFDALEVSAASGQPLELYRFVLGARPGFPVAPGAPGALVLYAVAATTVRDEGTTTESIDCPPTSPDSHVCGARGTPSDLFLATPSLVGYGFSVWGAYHGSIGGGGGWYFNRVTISGLLPSHAYIVRTLAGSFPAFQPHGIRLGTAPGVSENSLIGPVGVSIGNDASATPAYADTPFTSSAAGEIVMDVGHFDLEVSYASVVYLDGLWIYDPAEAATPTTPGGYGTAYNYTSADVDVVYQGETYLGGKASRITRLQPFRPGLVERSQSEVEVAVPRDHLLAALVRGVRAVPITVTVFNLHRGDLTDARTPLQGEIADCRDQGASCVLTLAGKGRRLDRKLPILTTQRDCTNTLYDLRCRVSEVAFQYVGGVITAIDTSGELPVVIVSGAAAFARPVDDPDPDNYFERGMLATVDGFKVSITSVDPGDTGDGDRLELTFLPPGAVVGAAVALSAGCSRAADVCHGRFDNLLEHMGEPTIPLRNPFGPAALAGL